MRERKEKINRKVFFFFTYCLVEKKSERKENINIYD